MPATESKAADVFAFSMFAVEVFTGKIPFEDETQATSALRILRGGRPEMPENALTVGLTGEMWQFFEICWQQNPEKRPTMAEVVRRWQGFVQNNDNVVTECVQITLVIQTPSSVPFSTSYDRPREPQPPGPTPSTTRLRTRSEAIQPLPEAHQLKTVSESRRLRTTPEDARPRTKSEAVHPITRSEVAQQDIKPEAVQPRKQSPALPPSESVFQRGTDPKY